MGEKIEKLSTAAKSTKGRITEAAAKVANHPKTEAAATWAKDAVTDAASDVADHARKVSKGQVARGAATGAVVGAAIAVPIPVIGPVFGSIVGAGIGALIGLKRSFVNPSQSDVGSPAQPFDFHKEMTELDDLRQKGILTQEEFEAQKKKLLRKR